MDEVCNDGIDDDCDGLADDDDPDLDLTTTNTWFEDADGDGFGNATASQAACEAPSGYVGDNTDCDDSDPDVHPGVAETCNGIDDDCDGLVDDDDPAVTGRSTWYADSDGDGYGDPEDSLLACEAPSGYLADNTDCDDTRADTHPGAAEIWYDGVDQDCDGSSDYDADGDGYESDGYGGTDCDDTDPEVHPSAPELCFNVVDDDCNGAVDDCTGTLTGTKELLIQDVSGADLLGHALATGDLTDDGWADVLLGAPLAMDSSGDVTGGLYLLDGPLTVTGTLTLDSSTHLFYRGEGSGDLLGFDLLSDCDLTGDGLPDLVVSAPGRNAIGSGGGYSWDGAVYLLEGPITATTGEVDIELVETARIDAITNSGAFLGASLACAPGYSSSGGDGLLVGAPVMAISWGSLRPTAAGTVYLFQGPLSGPLSVASDAYLTLRSGSGLADGFGRAVAWLEDGSGTELVVIGAPDTDSSPASGINQGEGAVYVVEPSTPGTVNVYMTGTYAYYTGDSGTTSGSIDWGDSLGYSLATGDLDGDGYEDLVVGAPTHEVDQGGVYVLYGPLSAGFRGVITATGDTSFLYGPSGSGVGSSVAVAGDLNGDGADELLVGASAYGSGHGRVHYVPGPITSSTWDNIENVSAFFSGQTGDYAGVTAPMADLDGDGLEDLLVGAPGGVGIIAGSYSAQVYLLPGDLSD